MNVTNVLLFLAAVCGVCSVVSAVLVAKAMERFGIKTPFPFIGVLVFRNLHMYQEVTRKETGRTGPLFYTYVVPINLAWVFALAAWGIRTV